MDLAIFYDSTESPAGTVRDHAHAVPSLLIMLKILNS
jgi:hypothetical protein